MTDDNSSINGQLIIEEGLISFDISKQQGISVLDELLGIGGS